MTRFKPGCGAVKMPLGGVLRFCSCRSTAIARAALPSSRLAGKVVAGRFGGLDTGRGTDLVIFDGMRGGTGALVCFRAGGTDSAAVSGTIGFEGCSLSLRLLARILRRALSKTPTPPYSPTLAHFSILRLWLIFRTIGSSVLASLKVTSLSSGVFDIAVTKTLYTSIH